LQPFGQVPVVEEADLKLFGNKAKHQKMKMFLALAIYVTPFLMLFLI